MKSRSEWYVVYTKNGCEQKVCDLLTKKKFECFAPVNRVMRNWHGKQKAVYKPLIDGYVFVYMDANESNMVRQTSGVLNFVYWLNRPAIISEEEIYTLRRFLNTYEAVVPEKSAVEMNSKVETTYETETVNDTERQIVKLTLPSLGYTIKAVDKTTTVTVVTVGKSRGVPDSFYAGAGWQEGSR